jgi:pimeloyl-ACP methyl ester carboxylesterase
MPSKRGGGSERSRFFTTARERRCPSRIASSKRASFTPAFPDVGELPVLVFHGRRDDVIPVETVERFARGKRNVTLRLLDDVHDLVESAPYLLEESARFIDAVAGTSSQ